MEWFPWFVIPKFSGMISLVCASCLISLLSTSPSNAKYMYLFQAQKIQKPQNHWSKIHWQRNPFVMNNRIRIRFQGSLGCSFYLTAVMWYSVIFVTLHSVLIWGIYESNPKVYEFLKYSAVQYSPIPFPFLSGCYFSYLRWKPIPSCFTDQQIAGKFCFSDSLPLFSSLWSTQQYLILSRIISLAHNIETILITPLVHRGSPIISFLTPPTNWQYCVVLAWLFCFRRVFR